jgi:hypothetical protein
MNTYVTDQVTALSVLIVFLVGITIGVVVSVSWAARLEDNCHSLFGEAPSVLCEGVRVFQGLYLRRGRGPGVGRPRTTSGTRPGWRSPGEPGMGRRR